MQILALRQFRQANPRQEETLPAFLTHPCPARFIFRGFLSICVAGLGFWMLVLPARAQNTEPSTWSEVRIASEGARPPYNYLDNNELAGFEIDLGRAICDRLAIKCSFVTQDWDALIPGLLDHQYDAIMAAMEITDERRQKIAFSVPYVRMPSAFMVARTSDLQKATPATLAGKTIGVEAGGTHQAYIEDMFKDSEIHTYSVLEDAILDLAESRIDTLIGDKDAIMDFLATRKEGQCCRVLADIPRDATYFGDGIGVGLRKEDKNLKAMFDKALSALMADGTFTRIRSRYFSFEIN
ncbi:MAG: transporter substrate-binding domain-containing protein [Beijerinckiaceae bacterium]